MAKKKQGYGTKCDKCEAKLGDVEMKRGKPVLIDGKPVKIPIFSYAREIGGKCETRCLKHLTSK
jgi:hypothetical protein